MFVRRIVLLNAERLARLAACTEAASGAPMLEDVVTAFVMPAPRLTGEADANARAIVVQYSLGRVLALPKVDHMLVRYHAPVRDAFVAALQRALPSLAPHQVVRRYYWTGGSLMVALAVPPGMVQAGCGAGGSSGRGGTGCRAGGVDCIPCARDPGAVGLRVAEVAARCFPPPNSSRAV